MSKQKTLIGRTDVADLPGLNMQNLGVKIDSGAFTSSIHCRDIQLINEKGNISVECIFLDESHPEYNNQKIVFESFDIKIIKSSNGQSEERYIVKTNISLFGKLWPIAFSLSNRSEMKYPILLGRQFLNHHFIIDTALTDLSYKQKTA